ncbi:MAG: hypothetical protein JXR70_01395 [Spirochaetales bacterium]|nr:hypothetical protein [Spirochaetales bacterium]
MVFRRCLFIFFLLVPGCFLFGDSWNTITLDLSNTFTRDAKDNYYLLPGGKASMSFEMDSDRNIKGGIELSLDAGLSFPLVLDRLFIKARFDDLRLTMGKTRLPWGRGFFFNAGDIIWDSTSLVTDLAAQEFRTDASFLFSPYFSLGRFTFLEAVVLTPDIDPVDMAAAQLAGMPPELPLSHELRAGLHGQTKFFGADIEAAYLFEGAHVIDEADHKAMVSLFLSPYMDLYASVSSRLPQSLGDSESYGEVFYDNLQFSFGTFYSHSFESGASLSGRLETLLFPSKEFKALSIDERAAGDTYALYLYPEISFAPEPIMQFFLRAILSPVDLSTIIMLGGNFETYQNLVFYIASSLMLGEEEDLFCFENNGGFSIKTGISYVY